MRPRWKWPAREGGVEVEGLAVSDCGPPAGERALAAMGEGGGLSC